MAFIYLASPYTHESHDVMEQRYQQVLLTTATLLKREIHVYSPIVHCHDMAVQHNLPRDITFWKKYNEAMLSASSGLWVLHIPGWETSKGLKHEIQYAIENSIPLTDIEFEER